jgi:hypothetical protein
MGNERSTRKADVPRRRRATLGPPRSLRSHVACKRSPSRLRARREVQGVALASSRLHTACSRDFTVHRFVTGERSALRRSHIEWSPLPREVANRPSRAAGPIVFVCVTRFTLSASPRLASLARLRSRRPVTHGASRGAGGAPRARERRLRPRRCESGWPMACSTRGDGEGRKRASGERSSRNRARDVHRGSPFRPGRTPSVALGPGKALRAVPFAGRMKGEGRQESR